MKIKFILLFIAAATAIAITACATKRYPIATPMSLPEASLMTCRDIEIELVRAEQVEH